MSKTVQKGAPRAKKAKPEGKAQAARSKERADDQALGALQSPYPGLNFYEYKYAPYFAGRDREIGECVQALLGANVLILHGATGCGKSSFLRAGVKPHIGRLGHGEGFTGGEDEFEVIRSTHEPLKAFAAEVQRIANKLTKKMVKPGKSPDSVREMFNDPRRGPRIGRDALATLEVARALADVMQPAPILVIDQAEEVFTLNTKRRREAAEQRQLTQADMEEREEEIEQYFRFLWDIAFNKDGANNGLRLVVSLRTEYKGQFDDAITRVKSRHPGPGLAGFYLDQLGEDGLVEAIRRPTLNAEEWEREVASRGLGLSEPPPRPPNAFKFRFQHRRDENGKVDHFVARRLARELLSGDAVPAGGVLPALQVACLRLFNQAARAMEGVDGEFVVRLTHLRRIGSLRDQIHEYLSECIEEECGPHAPQERLVEQGSDQKQVEFGELVDTFHKALARTLVGSEADGRAVTAQVDDAVFRAKMQEWFTGRLEIELVMDVMEKLVHRYSLLRKDSQGRWTLGHDSLALALNKWRLSFGRDDGGMRSMMMGMSRRPKDWDIDDLYEANDRPGPLLVHLSRDYFWDRQIPHYALHKGFARRLNITFSTSKVELSGLISDTKKKDKRWKDIVDAARNTERSLDNDARDYGFNGERVMVAAEWGAFPSIMRKEARSDDMFDPPINEAERKEVSEYAPRWTDVLATNINLGTGLIGPLDPVAVPVIDDSDGKSDIERLRAYRTTIRGALTKLAREGRGEEGSKKQPFQPANLGGLRMLQFAADLAFVPADGESDEEKRAIEAARKKVHLFLKWAEAGVETLANRPYEPREPIVEHLLSGVDKDEEQKRFATGGAFARALARQSGFSVYFGAKHVAALARAAMEARSDLKPGEVETMYAGLRSHDLAAFTQKCLAHTLWTMGITPAQASFGQERASVLRLASVGYFTTEYLRSNMDDFVAFIQHFVNRFLSEDTPGARSMRGVRISRDEVRTAMRDCFTFARFDELGEDVFDLDSVFAYWSDQAQFGAKSMAGAIYQDLVALREKTLDHFQNCAESIAWLRYNGQYEPSSDEVIGKAFAAKEKAWRHFKIYNFYDAERYMNKASQLLLKRIEAVARDKTAKKQADDARRK